MEQSDLHRDGSLKIGAVARLTGLSPHTLRKWEVRYDSVVPGRTERGQRVYTQSDVERLLLIKRLVDAGLAPRDVACLSLEQLTQKAEHMTRTEGVAGVASAAPVRVALVGSKLAATFERNHPAAGVLKIVASVSTAADLAHAPFDEPVDLLVYECASVTSNTRAEIDALMARLGVAAAVVLYRFSARGDLLSLRSPALVTLRAPADADTIERGAIELLRPGTASRRNHSGMASQAAVLDEVPAPRLSREAHLECGANVRTIWPISSLACVLSKSTARHVRAVIARMRPCIAICGAAPRRPAPCLRTPSSMLPGPKGSHLKSKAR